jgi:hypothetical protein
MILNLNRRRQLIQQQQQQQPHLLFQQQKKLNLYLPLHQSMIHWNLFFMEKEGFSTTTKISHHFFSNSKHRNYRPVWQSFRQRTQQITALTTWMNYRLAETTLKSVSDV